MSELDSISAALLNFQVQSSRPRCGVCHQLANVIAQCPSGKKEQSRLRTDFLDETPG